MTKDFSGFVLHSVGMIWDFIGILLGLFGIAEDCLALLRISGDCISIELRVLVGKRGQKTREMIRMSYRSGSASERLDVILFHLHNNRQKRG